MLLTLSPPASEMAPLVIKAALGPKLRRLALERTTLTFPSLLAVLASLFRSPVAVKYVDDDDDLIAIGSGPELDAAIMACDDLLRLSLVVEEVQVVEGDAPSTALSTCTRMRTASDGTDADDGGGRVGRRRSASGGRLKIHTSKRRRGIPAADGIALGVEGAGSTDGNGGNGELAFEAKRQRLNAGEEKGRADEVINVDVVEEVIDLDVDGGEPRGEPVAAPSQITGGGSDNMTSMVECAETSSVRDDGGKSGRIFDVEIASLAAGSGDLSIPPTSPLASAPLGSAFRLGSAKRNAVGYGPLEIDGEGGREYGEGGAVAFGEAGGGKVKEGVENPEQVGTTIAPSINLFLTDPVTADAQTALTSDSCLDNAPQTSDGNSAQRKVWKRVSEWSPKLHAMFVGHVEEYGVTDETLQEFQTAHAPEHSLPSIRTRAYNFGYNVKKGLRNPSQPQLRNKKVSKKAKEAQKAKKQASVASKPSPPPVQPSSPALHPSLYPTPSPATSGAVVYPSVACPSADSEAFTPVHPSSSPAPSVGAFDAVGRPLVVPLSANLEVSTPVQTAATSASAPDADCGVTGTFELLDDEAMAKLAESILAAEGEDVNSDADGYFEAKVLGLSQRVCLTKFEEEAVVGEPESARRTVVIDSVSLPAFQKSADAPVAVTTFPEPGLASAKISEPNFCPSKTGGHLIPFAGQSLADEDRNVFANEREDQKELLEALKIGAAGVQFMSSTTLATELFLTAPSSLSRYDASLDSRTCSGTLTATADQPGGGGDETSDHMRKGGRNDDSTSGGGVEGSKTPPQFRGGLISSSNSAVNFVSSPNKTSSSAEETDVSKVLPSRNAKLVDGAREIDARQRGSSALGKTGHASRSHRESDKEASAFAIDCGRLGSTKVVLCDDQLLEYSAPCGVDIDGGGCLSPISATEVDQEVEQGTAGQPMSNLMREEQSSSLINAAPVCSVVGHAPHLVREADKYSGPKSGGEVGELDNARITDEETEGIARSGSETLEAASQAPVAGLLANQLLERYDSGIDPESRGTASSSTLRSRDERMKPVLPGPFHLKMHLLQSAPKTTQNEVGCRRTALLAETLRNREIASGSKPSEWDVCARVVAGEVTNADRVDFLRLKFDVFAMSNFLLPRHPACLLVNALPYEHSSDEGHRQRRETELKKKLQDRFRNLNIVCVKALDSDFCHALVILSSQVDYSILLPGRQSSRRLPMQAGLGPMACLRTITGTALLVNLSNCGGDMAKVRVLSDLLHLSRSEKGHFSMTPTEHRDTFSVVGNAYNILMIIAMVGRKGRQGIKFRHQIYGTAV